MRMNLIHLLIVALVITADSRLDGAQEVPSISTVEKIGTELNNYLEKQL